MNADSADTRYPHLDLGDLIAHAAGQPAGDRVREHLASCEDCQREANRWNLVAAGVRGLAAAAPETARPARPRRTRRHVLPRPVRHGLLAVGSVAAALVLLVAIGSAVGVVHVHFGGGGTQTTLTAVTGCSQLEQADGTLEQVHGSSLVIKTASGQPVTVTTTATTFVSVSGALLGDITDGASVMVRGPRSDGTITAAIVTVGQPFSAVNPKGFVPVQGTVADASTAGFTLVTSSGTRIPVTTSGGTLVVIPHASPGQLQPGATIFALGHAGPDGTLSARGVAAITRLPQLPPGAHIGVSVKVKDCSPRSIDEAIGAISAAPGSGPG
jgi:predicted anti-sigma-YlaC factor YlaD